MTERFRRIGLNGHHGNTDGRSAPWRHRLEGGPMDWIERAALAAMLGRGSAMLSDDLDDDLVREARQEIVDLVFTAARLWVLAYPEEAQELRDAMGARRENKFLVLASDASVQAIMR